MEIKITNAKKIKIKEGDLLVFEVDAKLSPKRFIEWAEKFTKGMEELYPNIKVLVLPKEVQLKTILNAEKLKK
jgi:hypothetical protein